MANSPDQQAHDHARAYADKHGKTIAMHLGGGFDGVVVSTGPTAIKAARHEPLYLRERDVYIRLLENDVNNVAGFAVPKLVEFDDELQVIEMEIVSPPFIVDFAGAYLDERPDYPEDVLAAWDAEKREIFEHRWPTVRRIMAVFERWGVYLADVHPGNVRFADDASEVSTG